MKKLLALIAIFIVNCPLSTVHCETKPKLVVGIVIDQMRWDYLERYKDRYCEGGFRRMMDEGYNCTRCMINYIPAVTAVGHTSVYTGSVPALHGIVNNSFHVNGKSTSAPYDASMQTVGSTTDAGKRSPHLMMATTMGDELRMSTNFRSKVIGIAIKDRAAILPAGHSANAAYWLDSSPNDQFITSSYYMKELPKWVVDFNKRELGKEYMKRDWPNKMMYPKDTYVQSHPLDERIEIKVGDEVRVSPWGSTLTFDMAQAAVVGAMLRLAGEFDALAALGLGPNAHMGVDLLFGHGAGDDDGGGIFVNNGKTNLKNIRFESNTARANGGAFYSDTRNGVWFFGCTFFRNTAENAGGAVYVYNNNVYMEDCSVIANTSTDDGGGIYIARTCTLGIAGKTVIRGNDGTGSFDNLVLENNAYLYNHGLQPGSEIHLCSDTEGGAKLSGTQMSEYQLKEYFRADYGKLSLTDTQKVNTELRASVFSEGKTAFIIGTVAVVLALIVGTIVYKRRKKEVRNEKDN